MGLKRHAWRNATRSALVAAERMALAAVSLDGRLEGILFLRVCVSSPRLSEGLANAPFTGHSLTDVRLGERGAHLGAKGMDQRRLAGSRRPLMMTVPSLMIWTWYLVKSAAQSSSHNLPIDRRDPVERPSRTCPVLAVVESCGARGI